MILEIGIGIFLLTFLSDGYLLDRYDKVLFSGELPCLHYGFDTRTIIGAALGWVVVGNEAHLTGCPLDELKLLRCPCRTKVGYGVLHTNGMQTHTVGGSLHKVHLLGLSCRPPCHVQTKDRVTLIVKKRLLAIEILWLTVVHHPCCEADDVLVAVFDGDDDTVLEEVVALLVNESQLLEKFLLQGQTSEGFAVDGRKTDLYLIAILLPPAAVGIVLGRLVAQKHLTVMLMYGGIDNQ